MKSAEAGLRRCLLIDRTDARAYVVLGKLLLQGKRHSAARLLYQEGCIATGGCAVRFLFRCSLVILIAACKCECVVLQLVYSNIVCVILQSFVYLLY